MDLDMMRAAAAELVERLELLATLPATPGDSACAWLDHRSEAQELVELVGVGLHLMRTPE